MPRRPGPGRGSPVGTGPAGAPGVAAGADVPAGRARARERLEDWENALGSFVKGMPRDYKRALLQAHDRATAKAVAAE